MHEEEENEKKKNSKLEYWILGIITTVIITIIVVLCILAIMNDYFVLGVVILAIIGFPILIILLGFLTALFAAPFWMLSIKADRRRKIRKRKRQFNLEKGDFGTTQITLENDNQTATEIDEESILRPKIMVTKKKQKGIPVAIYSGSYKNQKCLICKLSFTKKQIIVVCPYCRNLFHKLHLKDWLRDDKGCPVCAQTIYVEDEKVG